MRLHKNCRSIKDRKCEMQVAVFKARIKIGVSRDNLTDK